MLRHQRDERDLHTNGMHYRQGTAEECRPTSGTGLLPNLTIVYGPVFISEIGVLIPVSSQL